MVLGTRNYAHFRVCPGTIRSSDPTSLERVVEVGVAPGADLAGVAAAVEGPWISRFETFVERGWGTLSTLPELEH